MRGTAIRRFGVRTAVTGLVVAGALVGTGGVAVADESDEGHDEKAAVEVDKDIDVDLGRTVDVDKEVEVDLGKILNARVKLKLGL